MKALVNEDGELVSVVSDTLRQNLAGLTVVDNVPEPVHNYQWSKATQRFVPRPPTDNEETDAALEADDHWQALKGASPAQIDDYLMSNAANPAQARQVLKIIILAVQRLARTR